MRDKTLVKISMKTYDEFLNTSTIALCFHNGLKLGSNKRLNGACELCNWELLVFCLPAIKRASRAHGWRTLSDISLDHPGCLFGPSSQE